MPDFFCQKTSFGQNRIEGWNPSRGKGEMACCGFETRLAIERENVNLEKEKSVRLFVWIFVF